MDCCPDLVARLEWLCQHAEGLSAQEMIGALEGLKAALYVGLTARVAQRHTHAVVSHPVDLAGAGEILGESADWVKHHGEEADRYGAAIRMGGDRISGYDVEGLLRWRRARTGAYRRG